MLKSVLIFMIAASQCLVCAAQKQVVTISSDEEGNSWQQFVSEEGRFSVLMPGVPTETATERDTPDGKLTFHSSAVKLSEAFYQVGYTDYAAVRDPQGFSNRILSSAPTLISESNAEVLSERDISIDNFPGKEWWVIQDRAAIGIRRMFVIRARIYQVNMLMSLRLAFKNGRASLNRDDQTAVFASAVSRFFDSFKITSPEPLGEVDRMMREIAEKKTGVVTMVGSADEASSQPMSGGVLNGRAVHLGVPAYPVIARAAHASGQVRVKVLIDLNGNVAAAQVVDGHPLLQAAAIKAARESKFTPTLFRGKPVMVMGLIIYNFIAQ